MSTYETVRDLQTRYSWSDESLLVLICEYLDHRSGNPDAGINLCRDLVSVGDEEEAG